MNTSFVVILNLLIIYLVVISWADETTKEPQLFSFEKLGKLTQLASCFEKIHEDFAHCNNKTEEEAKLNLKGVDQNSEKAKHYKCCATWKLRDCWVMAAKDKCDSNQTEQVHNLPYDFMPDLKEMCKDYPPGCI